MFLPGNKEKVKGDLLAGAAQFLAAPTGRINPALGSKANNSKPGKGA
jgi:hypothetical protein